MTDKLQLDAADASYAVQYPQGDVLRVALDGGVGRYRADVDGATSTVNATWVLDADGYAYLGAFFRRRADRGATAVLIDLNLEGEIVAASCHFIPGTLALASKDGGVFTVTAQLEVAFTPDEEDDEDIIEEFEGV